jgi:ABC-type lipoprotein export system ATPase subunit
MLQGLNRDMGKTILMVTHDPKAAEHARRIVYLEKGQLEAGTAIAMPAPVTASAIAPMKKTDAHF